MLAELDDALNAFEWRFSEESLRQANALMVCAAEPTRLTALLQRVVESDSLASLCERKRYQDKLVLYRSKQGCQLILHAYRAGHFERDFWIHNHRSEFAVLILRGGYVHTLYSVDEPPTLPDAPVGVRVLCARAETAGGGYALSTAAFHSVKAWPDTLSLLLRGPATDERALYVMPNGTRYFWRHAEGMQDTATKPMQREEVADAVRAVLRILARSSSPAGGWPSGGAFR
jgi:hypothetical protein